MIQHVISVIGGNRAQRRIRLLHLRQVAQRVDGECLGYTGRPLAVKSWPEDGPSSCRNIAFHPANIGSIHLTP